MVRRLWIAWACWATGPAVCPHLAYLGRDFHWLLSATTLGGFLVSWLLDMFRISEYVRDANMGKHSQSPRRRGVIGHVATFVQSFFVASLYEAVLLFALDSYVPKASQPLLRVFGRAVGVWLTFCTGFLRAPFRVCLTTAATVHLLVWGSFRCCGHFFQTSRGDSWLDNVSSVVGSVCTAIAAMSTQSYTPTMRVSKRWPLRVIVLLSSLFVFWSLVGSALYNHLELPDAHDRHKSRKFKEAFAEFYQSDNYRELRDVLGRWKTTATDVGLASAIKEAQADLFGGGSTRQADLRLLGLPADATTEMIRKKFRELSQTHYPRTSDNTTSNEKFVTLSSAYERLLEVQRVPSPSGEKKKEEL